MKKIVFLVVATIFASLCLAAESDFFETYDEKEIPLELAQDKSSFPEAPVIVCPRPLKKYADLLDQLNGIKTKIQSEACKESSIEVDSLESLISERRVEFVDLIKKGTLGEGQLSKEEVETVQTYVDGIVKKAASIAGLVQNEACFDQGDKDSTLGFLSSVISEVSGAVGAIAGPFGAKISLVGNLAGTFLSSVDTIVQARTTYDYGKPDKVNSESINNYLNNLCTYYDFKSDLDIESDLTNERVEYVKIYRATELYLQMVEEDCEACGKVIEDFQTRLARREGFDFTRVDEEIPGNAARATDAEGDDGERDLTPFSESVVAVENSTLTATTDFYRQKYGHLIVEPNYAPEVGMEAPVVVAEPVVGGGYMPGDLNFLPPPVLYVAPLDSFDATVRALQIQNWAKGEIIKIDELNRDSTGFDGRGAVAQVQNEIENFLAGSEARNYLNFRVKFHRDKLDKLYDLATHYLMSRNHQSMFVNIPEDPDFNYEFDRRDKSGPIAIAFHELHRFDIDFIDILSQSQMLDGESIERIRMNQADTLAAMNTAVFAMADSHGVLHRKCEFFRKSLFGNRPAVRRGCENADRYLAQSQKIGMELRYTSFADFNMGSIEPVFEQRPNFQASYVKSVKWSLCRDIDVLTMEIELEEDQIRYIKRLCQ